MKLIIHNESSLTDEHCLILCSLVLHTFEITNYNNHRYIDTITYCNNIYKIYGYENKYTKSIKITDAI